MIAAHSYGHGIWTETSVFNARQCREQPSWLIKYVMAFPNESMLN